MDIVKVTPVSESVPFDPTTDIAADNVQDAIPEAMLKQFAASAYSPFSPWLLKTGASDAVPLETTDYQTQSGMHDPTVDDSGTATSGAATTLTDTSKSWTTNQYTNAIIKITGGTGAGQFRKIASNTATVLTMATAWTTNPDATSTYKLSLTWHKIVVPVDGVYSVIANSSFPYAAGVAGLYIYVNGSFRGLHYVHQSQNVELVATLSKQLNLNANDEIDMRLYLGGATPLSIFGGSARLYLQVARI